MIELTKEQHEAMARIGDKPPRVRDPETEITYVLLREDVYDRIKSLWCTEEFDPDEGQRLMNEVMAEDDAGDPLFESYQKYRKKDFSMFKQSVAIAYSKEGATDSALTSSVDLPSASESRSCGTRKRPC